MKRYLLVCAIGIGITFSCSQNNDEAPKPTDFGYLSLNVSVSITSEPANGRVEAVSTDEWKVTIFYDDGTEALVFDPYSTAPTEIQLPTGEYYIEAHSNNFMEAAFENPYYFGRSANFTIDKEEIKTIDINAELANSKVAINYSSNVTNTFNNYTGAVTVVSSGTTLNYLQGETREGYFVSEPLSVVVDLSYNKLDGTFITRQFAADIDAQPKTLYNVNVDATLKDGEIVLNINVDETFETVEIELGDTGSDPNADWVAGDDWIDDRDGETYGTVQIGDQVWMSENLRYLPEVHDATNWTSASENYTKGYSVFNYDGNSVEEARQRPEYSTRGVIYNGWATMDVEGNAGVFTTDVQGACPVGWHVPGDDEWNALINYLGGAEVAGGKLKQMGTVNWRDPNVGATDEVGFNAIPGGRRFPDGRFVTPDIVAHFRTSTPDPEIEIFQVVKFLSYNNTAVVTQRVPNDFGLCVRCIKDVETTSFSDSDGDGIPDNSEFPGCENDPNC
ncbi:MAG: DUF4493 domain-containing protein [Cyclobacteriaceae bacterium]